MNLNIIKHMYAKCKKEMTIFFGVFQNFKQKPYNA